MPVQMGMWRVDTGKPRRLATTALSSEALLEEYLADDPSLLGTPLLVIGRQVRTPYNKLIDLLAIDGDGSLHVLELKRDRTPRDVVAQILDYGSWVVTLDREHVIELANDYLPTSFEAAFFEQFAAAPPDEINTELHLTVVASELDSSSERIITYLRGFGVPVNAVFFSHVLDGDRRYLARAWLAEEDRSITSRAAVGTKRAEWNGRDWFVNCGIDPGGRDWEDCRKYGFVGADGGAAYTRVLRSIPAGARINAYISKLGYVGVGEVLSPAKRFEEAVVHVGNEDVPLRVQALQGHYAPPPGTGDDDAHWILPVRWIAHVPQSEGYRESGLFSNPQVACKLRQQFTLDRLAEHFGLTDQD